MNRRKVCFFRLDKYLSMISYILCLSMLLSVFVGISYVDASNGVNVIFTDNFEAYDVGASVRTNWEISLNSNSCIVGTSSGLKTKAVKFTNNVKAGEMYLQKSTISFPEKGQVWFEADVMFEDADSASAVPFRFRDANARFLDPVTFNNGKIHLFDGSEVGAYSDCVVTSVDISLDFSKKLANIWIDGKRKAKDLSFSGVAFGVPVLFRTIVSGKKIGDKSVYMDNIYVYESDSVMDEETKSSNQKAVSAEDITKKMNSAIAMYEGRDNAFVYGTKFDGVPIPFSDNETMYVPIKFVCEMSGIDYKSSENEIKKGSHIYISADKAADIIGKKVMVDPCGLIIFSDEEDFLNWNEDRIMLNGIVKSFIYDDYSKEEIMKLLKEKNPFDEHPRLIARQEDFDRVKNLIQTDECIRKLWEGCLKNAENLLNQKPYEYVPNTSLLETSRNTLLRIQSLAMAYQISGDEKFGKRCLEELKAVCSFENWHPSHFLDPSEMSAAVALGYDWIYDYLSEEDKKFIENALMEKMLLPAREAIDSKTSHWVGGAGVNNWTFVCYGGATMAALAIGDRVETEFCSQMIVDSIYGLRDVLSLYAPDGAWEEGVVYWNYALKYHVLMTASLETALGSDMGIFDVPGMRTTADTNMSLNGPAGVFNFSDADYSNGASKLSTTYMTYLASKYNRPELAEGRLNPTGLYRTDGEYEMIWLSKINRDDISRMKMPLDIYSRGIETVTLRSSWSEDALFVGLHAGDNAAVHSHHDMGVFVVDSQDERFFLDLGKDNYDISAVSKQLYRGKAEGHNCIYVVTDETYDQTSTAKCTIDGFESSERGGYAYSDITSAYSFIADSYTRGIKLTDGRQAVIIQDEIKLTKPSELYWGGHTRAEITLSEDKQTAVLTQNGKKLLVKILEASGAEFCVMDAVALNPANTNPLEIKNPGVKKLAIKYDEFKEGTISIGITPIYGNQTSYDFEKVKPVREWTNEVGSLEFATADAIYMDGKLIDGFDKNLYTYSYEIPIGEENIPVISAPGCEVTQSDSQDGTALVKASGDGKVDKFYTVTFTKKRIEGIPDGYEKINIESVKASAEPQAENPAINAIDENRATRWSAENECNITLDIGKTDTIDGISLSFMNGHIRTSKIVVEVSNDGKEFKKVFEGVSSGMTEEMEPYFFDGVKARYIRVNLFGTSQGSWNSITEAKIIKKVCWISMIKKMVRLITEVHGLKI